MKLSVQSSRPEAVRYCFILLVSYYQQSQSTPTAPRTQSPFYITFIRRCTNVENIWRQPSELCFLRGWGASAEEGDLQLAHSASVHWAGRQWHHEGHLHSSPSGSHTSSYRFQFLTHVCVCWRISWNQHCLRLRVKCSQWSVNVTVKYSICFC